MTAFMTAVFKQVLEEVFIIVYVFFVLYQLSYRAYASVMWLYAYYKQ